MSEQRQILEQYLQAKYRDQKGLSITKLDKLRDGWESDNYLLSIEYGDVPRTHAKWVWRIYPGLGSQAKAVREFTSMKKLFSAGYPVPQVFLLESEDSPVDRPFILMEYIQGEMMWELLDRADAYEQVRLIDKFCQLFVKLHELDWRLFDDRPPIGDPFTYFDQWLENAHRVLNNFPQVDASQFLDWVTERRESYACERPSPTHQDFHPGNVLVSEGDRTFVIDWTSFEVTDPRFDLAWTLMLAHAYGIPGLRDQIFQGYQHYAGRSVEQIEAFEAIACARRLLDVAVSLTQGAQNMGMNSQATEAMRANMEPHQRVYRLFYERTGLQSEAFDNLFGKPL